jgi:hypothetical protein
MKKTLVSLLIVFLFFAFAAVSEAAVIKVKVTTANIRQQPDAQSAVISRAAMGTMFEVVKKTGNWYEITAADATGKALTGYINADVVEEIGGAPAQPRSATPTYAPAYAAPRASSGASSGKFLIMFGPVLSNLSYSGDISPWTKSSRFGFAGGVGYEFPMGRDMSAVAGLIYSTGGANFAYSGTGFAYKESDIANALVGLFQFKYSFNGPYVAAGPYLGLVLSPKLTWDWGGGDTGEQAYDTANMNTMIFGLVLGGGYEMDFGNMRGFIQLSYNLGLSNLVKNTGSSTDSIKPNSINIIFGIKL